MGSRCSPQLIKTSALTLGLILCYYFFSMTLTFYNKKIVTKYSYPLIMTCIHLIVKFVLASSIRNVMQRVTGKSRVYLNWQTMLRAIAPVGITSILDIGLSNWSFEFITVSLYTMTKTTAIVFLLLFALLLGVETFRWLQVIVVLFISLGLFLFTYESTQFNLTGFIMCLIASALSGLRWSLTQKVSQRSDLGLGNPIDFMYHAQPWMLIVLIPIAVFNEGYRFSEDEQFLNYCEVNTLVWSMLILLVGALLAFGLEFSEFLLVGRTSGLTLSVSAMFKEVCTLILSNKLNHDEINAVNILGLISCLTGIAVHVYIKAQRMKEIAAEQEEKDNPKNDYYIPLREEQDNTSL